jgi:hypothetical protein
MKARSWVCGVVLLFAGAVVAKSEGRKFVLVYPSHVEEKGTLEFEAWSTGTFGQFDSTTAAWSNRMNFEYAASDRFAIEALFEYSQPPAGAGDARFEGPGLQFIYALADEGEIPFDPALELELRESGDEFLLEPSLLLTQERERWTIGANLAAEFEWNHHAFAAAGNPRKALYAAAGLARDLNEHVSLAVEGVYAREFEDGGRVSALMLGPTLDLHADKVGLTLGWHPQVTGSPDTAAGLNLADFGRSQFRMILGIEF